MKKLTPEEKRIKIAEACGWKKHPHFNDLGIDHNGNSNVWPDYLNDLNAIHEAVQSLAQCEHARFECLLVEITSSGAFNIAKQPVATMHYCDALTAVHATAAQRAEAFGLTLGLWEKGQ